MNRPDRARILFDVKQYFTFYDKVQFKVSQQLEKLIKIRINFKKMNFLRDERDEE